MPPIAPIGNSIPSMQPQTKGDITVNPGLNANQISLATAPASFSQGMRFFITENNGKYQLNSISTNVSQSSTAPNAPIANPSIPADALEVNASIAYAITTGVITPGSYMAEHNAQTLRLNDAIKQVGSSPLQPPSLTGEITGDQFDASSILQFLKKNKGEIDDSNTAADLSAQNQDLISKTILANLQQALSTYDSDTAQMNTLQAQLQAERAKASPNQSTITNLSNQISSLTTEAATARATAEQIGRTLFADVSKGGISALRKDLDKLHKDQIAKLSKTVTNAVTKSIANQIDQALLGDDPIATPSNSPILKTADGSVIKTPQEQAKVAILAQLQSKEFKAELTQSIMDNADALGLSSLSSEELRNIASAVANATVDAISNDPQIIDDALNNADALSADVSHILELELEGHSGRTSLPNNV